MSARALKIAKWGNSAALRIPAAILKNVSLQIGDAVEAVSTKDGLLIREKKRSIADMSIDEIVAMTSAKAVEQNRAVNREAIAKRPVGRELI